eukprot:Nk52_evm37s2152 gene=Nk52_evmTU37s2152
MDDASSALIAKMLQEDSVYGGGGGMGEYSCFLSDNDADDPNDDCWGEGSRSKAKKKRKQLTELSFDASQQNQSQSSENSATKKKAKRSSTSKGIKRPPVTILNLIEAGLLEPAYRLTFYYQNVEFWCHFLSNGKIKFIYEKETDVKHKIGLKESDGTDNCVTKIFDSVSSFTIFAKRLKTPTRKADDGWKTTFLGRLKDRYWEMKDKENEAISNAGSEESLSVSDAKTTDSVVKSFPVSVGEKAAGKSYSEAQLKDRNGVLNEKSRNISNMDKISTGTLDGFLSGKESDSERKGNVHDQGVLDQEKQTTSSEEQNSTRGFSSTKTFDADASVAGNVTTEELPEVEKEIEREDKVVKLDDSSKSMDTSNVGTSEKPAENSFILKPPSEYLLNRPKRKRTTRALAAQEASNINPLSMIKCDQFANSEIDTNSAPSVARSSKNQPFRVRISSNAMFLMDLHSHLAKTEVIGYLAGTFDKEKNDMHISKVFACRSIECDDNGTEAGDRNMNVEMDPASEMEVRDRIANSGLQVCGWYHSHPVFQPDPSVKDIENQTSYQNLFALPRDGNVGTNEHSCTGDGGDGCGVKIKMSKFAKRKDSTIEAFVGVIVGPYDVRMPTDHSVVNCFWVNQDKGLFPGIRRDNSAYHGTPMAMIYSVETEKVLKGQKELMTDINWLIDYYCVYPQRQLLKCNWRHNTSKLDKARITLAKYLPIEEFGIDSDQKETGEKSCAEAKETSEESPVSAEGATSSIIPKGLCEKKVNDFLLPILSKME